MRLPAARALDAIQSGKLSPGYIFLGKDIYWRDRLLAALRRALGVEDAAMAVSEYDLRSDPVVRVLDAARERSLLAPRRLLIVRNAQSLGSRRRTETEGSSRRKKTPSSQPARSDALSDYFRDPNPDAVMVLEMMDVDLDTEEWRERERVQSRLESCGTLCDIVLLAAPSFSDAIRLVRDEAEARGCAISPDAAELLLAAFDRDMGRIRMELEKLSVSIPEAPPLTAKRTEGRIELEDVWRLSVGAAGGSGLPLVEALGSGDRLKALGALAEIERSGMYAPLVLLELTRYLRQLILLREQKVRDPRQASSVLWSARLPASQSLLPFLLDQSRKIKGRSLLSALQASYEAEIALRSGPPSDRVILERLVLQIVQLSHAGSS